MRSDRDWRLDGRQREVDLRLGFLYVCAAAEFRSASYWVCRLRDQRRMDDARGAAAFCNFIRCRSFSEQSVATSSVVHDWSRRRLDCLSWFTPESDGRADDLLADGACLGSNYFLCNVLLPRECRSVPEPSVAINCRPRYPRLCRATSSCGGCNVDKRFCFDRCRSAGQYVADGPVHRAIVTDFDLHEVWTGASAKAFARGKRRRFCGGDRHSPNPDCGGAGGSSGSTAQPVANVDPKRAKRRSLDGRARSNWRPS